MGVRLQIEYVVAMIRTAQNTTNLVELQRGTQHSGADYGSYGA